MTNEDNNIQNHNFDILKENIERLRKENGWSQKELGEKIGLEQSNISKCLSGGRCFTLEQVWRLADLFETSVDELLGNTRKGNKDSIEDICKFLGRLITQQIIVPAKISVHELIWAKNELESGEVLGYSQNPEVVNTYIALYFPNYEQIEDNLADIPLQAKLSEFGMCGNSLPYGIEVNKFLNKFLSTLSKYNKGILDEEEYEAIIKTYLKSLKKTRA